MTAQQILADAKRLVEDQKTTEIEKLLSLTETIITIKNEYGDALNIIAGLSDAAYARSLAIWVLEGGTIFEWERKIKGAKAALGEAGGWCWRIANVRLD